MTWRRVPPVFSPVSTRAMADGFGALFGFGGDSSRAVEEVLRTRYDCEEVILTDSGTSALLVVWQTLLAKQATVALPAYCCIDVTAAAVAAGVRVRLYDLDPITLSPNPDSVRAVMRRGVDAIVVAHLYGYPADVQAVQELAMDYRVPVIEDAAQAAGGSVGGKLLGGFGDISILSFGRGKGTTAGAGGAVLLKSSTSSHASSIRAALRGESRGASELASVVAQSILAHPALYRLPSSLPMLKLGEMVYHPAKVPRAISHASAALLRHTSAMTAANAEARRVRAAALLSEISPMPDVTAVKAISGGSPGYLRLAFLDATGVRQPRPDVGVLRGYPLTLDQHSQLQPLLHPNERAGTGSTYLRDRLFTIPTHSRVSESDFLTVIDWLRSTQLSAQAVPAFS